MDFFFKKRKTYSTYILILLCLVNYFQTQEVSQIGICPTIDCGELTSSKYGGGRLYIRGSGFDAIGYDNKVFVGTYVCEINNYYTSDSYLVCQMPFMFYNVTENQNIAVYVKGVSLEINYHSKSVNFASEHSPFSNYIYPSATWAGEEIGIYGIHRAQHYEDIQSVKLADYNCELDMEDSHADNLNYWSHRYMYCKIPESIPSGNYQVQIEGKYGSGFSKMMKSTEHFRLQSPYEKYNVLVHPKIESISPSEGYMNGQRVTIKGKGFGDDLNEISIEAEGITCDPESVTPTEIVCILSKTSTALTKSVYEGNAGLKKQLFHTSLKFDNLYQEYTDNSKDINEAHNEHAEGDENKTVFMSSILSLESDADGESYVNRMYGIFTAPTTGEYTFYLTGDDMTRLYLSTNPINENQAFDESSMMELLCNQTYETVFRMFYTLPEEFICTKTMTAGDKYYMVYLHRQGRESDSFSVGLEVPNTDSSKPGRISNIQEVKINNTPVREVQEIKICGATSGTYTITYDTTNKDLYKTFTSKNIAWNSSASDFQQAIYDSSNWWFLVVSLRTLNSSGSETSVENDIHCFEYTLTFNNPKGEYNAPFVNMNKISPNNASVNMTTITQPSDPVSGTFKLSYNGEVTEELSYDTWYLWMEYYLEQLPSLSDGVTVYSKNHYADGYTWLISLDSVEGDGSRFQVVDENLSGGATGNPSITVNKNYVNANNNLFFRPISSDFLSTFHSKPQFKLMKNNLRAVCPSQNCDYTFINDSDTPVISNVNVSSNSFSLTLKTGHNSLPDATLLETASNFTISYGGYSCDNVSVNGSTITCSLPLDSGNDIKYEAGSLKPEVLLKDKGFLIIEANANEVDPIVSGVTPSTGSKAGGTLLTISGKHFSEDKSNVSVSVGSFACEVVSSSYETITCLTSEQTTNTSDKLSVTVNSKTFNDSAGSMFQYDQNVTPTVTSLDKSSVSPILKQILTISGSGFGSDPSKITVMLVPKSDPNLYPLECFKVNGQVTDTSIQCHLSGGKSGDYAVEVTVDGQGSSKASSAGVNDITLEITVSGVDQSSGSAEGGHLITLTGTNFSSVLTDNQVIIGENKDICFVESATPTQIQCRTRKPKEVLSGPQDIFVYGRITEEARCSGTCKYTFSSNNTPDITQISPASVKSGDTITITGTSLKSTSGGTSTVYLGSYEVPSGNISSITNTSIVFTMPAISTLQFEIGVNVDGKGKASLNVSNNQLLIENPFKVLSLNKTNGVVGGDILTISGNAFISKEKTSVMLGNQDCFIESFAHDEITCWVWHVPGGTNSTKSIKVKNTVETVVNNQIQESTVEETCDACTYTTQSGQAPGISGISNTNYSDLTNISMTISGAQLNANVGTASVYLYSMDQVTFPNLKASGNVSAGSAGNEVDLTFTNVPAGNYTILYYIPSLGFAQREDVAKNILLNETGLAVSSLPDQSYAGGNVMTITGSGFLANEYKDTYAVKVCGNECKVTESSFTSLKCEIPMLNTRETQAQFNLVSEEVLTDATIINDYNDPQAVINDKDFSTNYFGQENCFIGYDFGDGRVASVSKIRIFPSINKHEEDLIGAVVQGAMSGIEDDSNWTDLFTIDEQIVENWNSFFPDDPSSPWEYRYFRLKNNNYCRITEFELTGRIFNVIPNFNISSTSCDVSVQRGSEDVSTLSNAVTYTQSTVSTITSISPEIITTAGGETVTITGTNLDKNGTVEIDGIDCNINVGSSSSTSLVCTTGARSEFTEPSLRVLSSSGLAVTNDKLFLYADRWSSTATWGGESLPRAGDLVHVPTGQTLLVDVEAVPRLASIVVEGILIFEDFGGDKEKTFDADFIMVRDGVLRIGTEDDRYESILTITLHGDRTSTMFPGFGNKNIMVQGGSIDIHGKERNYTWTDLNASVNAGASTIVVRNEVDWQVGEKIIIAPTNTNREEYEERTITSVSLGSGIASLGLDAPLLYNHFADDVTHGGKTTSLRGEVGLLTRNVVVQGDSNSERDQYGSHIMIRGEEGKVIGRFSYFETRFAGQAFQMGRYPLHFHMIGNVIGSYIEGCSVHHTYNRATTIHGVHYLRISNNVYFKHLGHGIFVEDSIETNNIVENNLVIHVTASASLLESDLKVAGVWITHPNNYFRGNHIIGSEFFGFWFDLPGHPTGPSATKFVCPEAEELGQFDNNYGHTNGTGFRIYPFYRPMVNPCGPDRVDKLSDPFALNEPNPVLFRNNVFYMNRTGVLHRDIGAVQHDDLRLIGNEVGLVIASPKWARDQQPRIDNSLFVGYSPITEFHQMENGHALHTSRKDGFLVKDSQFVNYDSSFLIKTCNACNNEIHRDIGGRRTTFEGITFENVTNKLIKFTNAEQDKDIFHDKDGSLITHFTGQSSTGGWITTWNQHLNIPECQKVEDKADYPLAVCNNDVSILRLEISFESDKESFEGSLIKVMNLDMQGESFAVDQTDETKYGSNTWRNVLLTSDFEGFTINLATNYDYNIHFAQGIDFNDITVKNNLYWVEDTRMTTIRFNNTVDRETYEISLGETVETATKEEVETLEYSVSELSILSSAPTSSNSFGDYFYDAENKFLTVKVDGKKTGYFKAAPALCEDNCPTSAEEEVVEDEVRKWSEVASWGDLGKVPEEGDDVVIEPTWNMVVDSETAILNSVTIQGKLSFTDDNETATLNANVIDIDRNGEFVIGTNDSAFTKKAKIVLHGTTANPNTQVGIGINPINKGIVVRGKMEFYGNRTMPIWTFLKENAAKDATTIKVVTSGAFNWQVGDKLVISSSSTNHEEVDEVTIKTVSSSGIIELEEPLKYFHYGALSGKSLANGEILDMRAEVGNYTRNIVIESSQSDELGCTILVPRYKITDPVEEFIQGNIILDSVQISKCGQKDSENGALNIRKVENISSSPQQIMYSSISNSEGKAITLYDVDGVSITHNLIFNARKTGIYMEEDKNVTVENNVMIKVRKRENFETHEFYDIISGIYRNNQKVLEDDSGTVIRNNRVSSVSWFGYIVSAHDCNLSTTPNFANNVAHSCMAGWFPIKTDEITCQKYSHFHAFKNSEEGFVSRQNGNLIEISDMVLADNKNAFAVSAGTDGKEIWGGKLETKDITIFGRALPDCSECYQGEGNCEHNGIYTALFNEDKYTFVFEKTRMPLHNSTSAYFNLFGEQSMENIRFENFNEYDDCEVKGKAIRLNNFYQSGVVSLFSKNIVMQNVDINSKFFFSNHTIFPDAVPFCGQKDCTGIYNIPIYDLDGSLSDNSPKHYTGYNIGAKQDENCTFNETWNGFECSPELGQLNIMNRDSDRNPVITPAVIEVIDYPEDFDENLKFKHSVNSQHKIVGLVKLNRMHSITYSATMPSGLIYKLMSPNRSSSEYIIVKVHSENPAPLYLMLNGKKVKNEIIKENEEVDFTGKLQCGTNFYLNNDSVMYFVLTGEDSCQVEIKNSNAINLNARMDISVEDFYKNDGITNFIDRVAASLGISTDRIRVVRVYTGSTHVDFIIERENSIESENEVKAEAITELESLAQKFEQEVDSGDLDLGAPVLGIESDLKIDTTPETQDTNNDNNDNTDNTDDGDDPVEEEKSNKGLYIGLGVGIPLALIAIFGISYAIYYFKCKNKKTGSDDNSAYKSNENKTLDKGTNNEDHQNVVYLQDEYKPSNNLISKNS